MGITGYVLLALLAVLSVYFATIYNNLVRLKHTVTKNWSNVSTLTVTAFPMASSARCSRTWPARD